MDEPNPPPAQLEAEVEGQLAHELLRVRVGVGERPRDRLLAELAVERGGVEAAAVFEVAGDRVVVVAVDGRDLALLDRRADLVRMRPVTDEVAAAGDPLDAALFGPRERRLQGRKVGVEVGDDRDQLAS
jgi:hypothetical protein